MQELGLAQFAREETVGLIAIVGDALSDKLLVEIVVSIHVVFALAAAFGGRPEARQSRERKIAKQLSKLYR